MTVGGKTVWSSIADYHPPPLEVLRNPWIQWTVLLPRDIHGPEYDAIHEVGPAALRALGVRDALTHMEWFRRPDGSVAVSEVAARPPGAQLTSMHGYAHDFDLYRRGPGWWCSGGSTCPSVGRPPARRTCAAWAAAACARSTAWTSSADRSATWWSSPGCRGQGQPAAHRTTSARAT